ncbi:hypothetical protein, partial [Enterobacter hormaechei]
ALRVGNRGGAGPRPPPTKLPRQGVNFYHMYQNPEKAATPPAAGHGVLSHHHAVCRHGFFYFY